MFDLTALPDWTGAALLWAIGAVFIVGLTKNLWARRAALLSLLSAVVWAAYVALGGRELAF